MYVISASRLRNQFHFLVTQNEADFQTDSEIQTLTLENLHELFPGQENLELRNLEIILMESTDLEESKAVTQQDSARERGGFTSGLLSIWQYVCGPLTPVVRRGFGWLLFIPRCVIWLLSSDTVRRGFGWLLFIPRCVIRLLSSDTVRRRFGWLLYIPHHVIEHLTPDTVTVSYKMVVSGETFGADQQLLDQIQTSGLNLTNDEESRIIIVFCPVTSRHGTDAEAAMRTVPDGDPVILVLMHYSQEPKHVSSSKVLSSYRNVVLEVNIFYHNRMKGLLKCRQNENAVIELKEELKKYSRPQRSGFNHVNHSNRCAIL